jgi:hypothetical protein
MVRTVYRGYVIKPRPFRQTRDRRWKANFSMSRPGQPGLARQSFTCPDSYDSMTKAAYGCLACARRIIDGQIHSQTLRRAMSGKRRQM